jgi:hypothetical protein
VAKEEIDKEVDKFAKTLAVFMNQELNIALEKGSKGSGNPQDADLHFTSNVILTQGGYTVQIVAVDSYGNPANYWDFIDKGVDGTKKKYGSKYSYKKPGVKVKPIADWIDKNSIDAQKIVLEMRMKRRGALSDLPKKTLSEVKKQLSYADAKKTLSNIWAKTIARDGQEPKPYIDNAFKRMDIGGFAKRMATLLGNSITIDLNLNDEKINLSL